VDVRDAEKKEHHMAQSEKYDAVLFGSGEAGKHLAWWLGSQGKRIAVVERRYVGGSCPNIACLPSKNVIHSAEVANFFRRASEFGIAVNRWNVEMAGVRDRKRKMVDAEIAFHLRKYSETGVDLVFGQGRFVGPRTIEVSDGRTRTLAGDMVAISTGSRARIDPIPGLAESGPMTHVEALDLDRLPEHLLVLGGGYVGLEFAQAMRRFGSRVTIVDRNEVLGHREDLDVSQALHELFHDEGIQVRTRVSIERVEGRSGDSVRLRTTRGEIIEGSDLLVAMGRTPNTDGIGLETAGIERDRRGFVKVDERLRTSAPGVWAVGDCAGSPHFTHIALDDFRVVRDNLSGIDRTTTGRLVPSCIFLDPELAQVGLSESEAAKRNIEYRLAKIPTSSVLRAETLSETRGFLKALIATDSDRILGFTAFCPAAGEVLAVVEVAIAQGLPYTDLRDAILTHPTMAEGLGPLFSNVQSRF
jgi:pyruvate/2-oxoglutarate dehydrogenase complex dihydrolipoamide dehydrogenase (E3) component